MPSPSGIKARVLGPVEVVGSLAAPEPNRAKTVVEIICFLALHRHRTTTGEEIRAAIWGNDGPEGSAKTLRSYLSQVRDVVGTDVLPRSVRGGGYRATERLTSDWEEFCSLVERADDLCGEDQLALFDEALALVRGIPFEGVDYRWAASELLVSQMEVAVSDVASRLATARIAERRFSDAANCALRGLLAVPSDFSLWRLLLEASDGLGPDVGTRARRDARAVLGDDIRFVEAHREG